MKTISHWYALHPVIWAAGSLLHSDNFLYMFMCVIFIAVYLFVFFTAKEEKQEEE